MPDLQVDQDDARFHKVHYRRPSSGVMGILGVIVLGALASAAALYIGGYDFKPVKAFLVSAGLLQDFESFYRDYHMRPLPDSVAQSPGIFENLVALQTEKCDKRAVYAADKKLDDMRQTRAAAELLLGFAQRCTNSEGELRAATDHLIALGDFGDALAQSQKLVALRPDAGDYLYRLAKSEAGLGRTNEALQDYANTIKLSPAPQNLSEHVFFEMAQIYAAKQLFCEAITPVQTYVSLDPGKRDNPQTRKLIDDYASKGACTSYAQGGDKFTVLTNDVIPVRVLVNGVAGNFALDTGASFVSLSEAFAKKAGITEAQGSVVATQTANGASKGRLASAATISAGHAAASAVPVLVVANSLGRLDGLLGRSFLSRFDVTISGSVWTLKSKRHGG